MYPYIAKFKHDDLIYSSHALRQFQNFRRGFLGINRIGKEIGARTFGSIIFDKQPQAYSDPLPVIRTEDIENDYDWQPKNDIHDERFFNNREDA